MPYRGSAHRVVVVEELVGKGLIDDRGLRIAVALAKVHIIGMLLKAFTSRAPTAIAATIPLDVRPFNAACDLATPAGLMSGFVHIRICRIDQNPATPRRPCPTRRSWMPYMSCCGRSLHAISRWKRWQRGPMWVSRPCINGGRPKPAHHGYVP